MPMDDKFYLKDIAEGQEEWTDAMRSFYKEFHPMRSSTRKETLMELR